MRWLQMLSAQRTPAGHGVKISCIAWHDIAVSLYAAAVLQVISA
jgi:hypothetical protein